MRLGQLARKYNIKQDEVILFLNKVQAELSPFHHNSKVSDDMEGLVTDYFSIQPKAEEEDIEEQNEEMSDATDEQNLDVIEIEQDKKSEAALQQELDPTLPFIQATAIEKKDEKSIEIDRLLELLEADEVSSDLSKITHIKVPKKELSGLKIVGKIELAEPKIKLPDKSKNQDKATNPISYNRHKGQRLSEEEKDSRRRKSKEKKEQYEARQEKRRIEGENKKRKAQKKARYEEKMLMVKANQAKQHTHKEVIAPKVKPQPQVYKPITIFDKFWKLFNL